MKKTRFASDYGEGAHPRILQRLAETNLDQTPGYGEDAHCEEAARLIQERCGAPKAAVHFATGGTQANLLAIASALRPHQAVVAPATGHISRHETGAIEATGHKVIELPGQYGKLSAAQVETLVLEHHASPDAVHMPQPKQCYLSFPTEYGTLYTREELAALRDVCRRHGLYLYIDGARLGYGLCAPACDLDLPFLAECCDAFSIGGTKVGALFGDALVIVNPALQADFRYIMKQRGAMLAKGWLLGLQFEALFEDDLYFEGARHAIRLAGRLADALQQQGHRLLMPPATNQIFVVLRQEDIDTLRQEYEFEDWEPVDDKHTAVRFCTAWSTRPEAVDALVASLDKLRRA